MPAIWGGPTLAEIQTHAEAGEKPHYRWGWPALWWSGDVGWPLPEWNFVGFRPGKCVIPPNMILLDMPYHTDSRGNNILG